MFFSFLITVEVGGGRKKEEHKYTWEEIGFLLSRWVGVGELVMCGGGEAGGRYEGCVSQPNGLWSLTAQKMEQNIILTSHFGPVNIYQIISSDWLWKLQIFIIVLFILTKTSNNLLIRLFLQ